MTIPVVISSELASLQAQVKVASPLNKANHATITALQLNAASLLKKINGTLTASNNPLDTWGASENISTIIKGVLELEMAAEDQNTLALMEGIVGRASTNLDQLT